VYGLGASTKGNVLLQEFGIDDTHLAAIGEVNEDKFGSYTPGSLVPIRPEAEVLALDPDYLFVLPWHFRSFFESLPSLKGRKLVFPLPQFEIVQL
jgi:ABC-type Fe3+-hydroxamate transport system substrate-binding protein